MLIRTSGADVSSYIWPDQAIELALLLGNGLEGEVHFSGNTEQAVALIRELLISTGACRRVDGPAESYIQPPSTAVFLDPQPTGEILQRHPRRLDEETLRSCCRDSWNQLEVREVNRSWGIGGLEIPKTALLPPSLTRSPVHRRGCLTYPLEEDMRFVTMVLDDRAALVLRARWADHFAAWTPLARQAEVEELAGLLNEEIAQAWRRYRAGQSETNHQ